MKIEGKLLFAPTTIVSYLFYTTLVTILFGEKIRNFKLSVRQKMILTHKNFKELCHCLLAIDRDVGNA